jgi:diketogulonate reductase-like aldo/keto reductase
MPHQDIVDYCREHGIAVMGYSPLAKGKKMNDAKLNALAARLVLFSHIAFCCIQLLL